MDNNRPAVPNPSPAPSSHDELECLLRLPFADAETASMVLQVLKSEPVIAGVSERRVQLWPGDATRCTVEVVVRAKQTRAMRSTVGAVLEQAKLIVRTTRAFTP